MPVLPPDPYRGQLDERWHEYLCTHERREDHVEWMDHALANYRDEVVHFGAQLLNDQVIHTWDERSALEAFQRYVMIATQYDRDPEAWEQSYWNELRAGLPIALRKKLSALLRRDEGDKSPLL